MKGDLKAFKRPLEDLLKAFKRPLNRPLTDPEGPYKTLLKPLPFKALKDLVRDQGEEGSKGLQKAFSKNLKKAFKRNFRGLL